MMMFSAHLVQYCVTGDNISGEGRSRGRTSLPRRGRRAGESFRESGKRAGGGCRLSSFLALSRIVL